MSLKPGMFIFHPKALQDVSMSMVKSQEHLLIAEGKQEMIITDCSEVIHLFY